MMCKVGDRPGSMCGLSLVQVSAATERGRARVQVTVRPGVGGTKAQRGHARNDRSVWSSCKAAASELESSTIAQRDGEQVAGLVALKEWAVTISALQSGEQTIVVRKGGIREPHFDIRDRRFWLLPTSFHEAQDCVQLSALAEEPNRNALSWQLDKEAPIQLQTWAECVAAWKTLDNPGSAV